MVALLLLNLVLLFCWLCEARVLLCVAANFKFITFDLQLKLKLDEVFDCASNTPTLEYVRGFSCVVLVSSDPFRDSDALGNIIADYVDSGGRVVLTVAAFEGNRAVRGRFAQQNYLPVTLDDNDNGGSESSTTATMLMTTTQSSTVADPLSQHVALIWSHFLLRNVSSMIDGDTSMLVREDAVRFNFRSTPITMVKVCLFVCYFHSLCALTRFAHFVRCRSGETACRLYCTSATWWSLMCIHQNSGLS